MQLSKRNIVWSIIKSMNQSLFFYDSIKIEIYVTK